MDISTMSLFLGFVDSSFLLGALPKQRSAPRAHREQRSEQNDGVNASAAFARPVYVAQVQPQCEFIERKRRACTVQNRHQSADKDRRDIRSWPLFGDPPEAAQKKTHTHD